jgi:hypothetical protein
LRSREEGYHNHTDLEQNGTKQNGTKRNRTKQKIMPRSSKPSRRRVVAVADGSSGGNHPPDSSDVTGIASQIFSGNGRYKNTNANHSNNNNDDDDDDDGKNRKPHRRRPWCNPVVSIFSSRTTFAILVVLAMMGVGGGIIVGIFAVFSPPKPKTRFVTIERSNYKYTPSLGNSDNNNNIVLGKRPRPPDSEGPRAYHPSALESYVIENGRTDPKLGYDRQVVQYRDDDTPEEKKKASFVTQPSDIVALVSLFGHLRKRISENNNNNIPLTHVDYSDLVNTQDMPSGCELWVNPEVTTPQVYSVLQTYRTELEAYELYLSDWTWTWEPPKSTNEDSLLWAAWNWNSGVSTKTETRTTTTSGDGDATARKEDLRDYMDERTGNKDVCESLNVHPKGLPGIFISPLSLSKLPSTNNNKDDKSSTRFFLEPFLPPLRHPEFCYTDYSLQKLREHETKNGKSKAKTKTNYHTEQLENENNRARMDTGYIVHDFAAMCKNNLHTHSKTVFVDVGASFDFRYDNKESSKEQPRHNNNNNTMTLLRLYQRFGFVFDHIYGYKVATTTPQKDPSNVFWEIPDDFKASYHWYNVGVDTDSNSYANPFKLISETFKPDDFVVVKLDIDIDTNTNTPGEIESALAHQLLLMEEFERTSKPPFQHKLSDLIDVIYFEHHFTMKEMAVPWNGSMKGSMQDSMEFFTSLREHGIAAHYWI